eukprot:874308-Prorocentrum_minimum.AAC.7
MFVSTYEPNIIQSGSSRRRRDRWEYAPFPHMIGPYGGNMPRSLTRLARTVGICPVPSHDWPVRWKYAPFQCQHRRPTDTVDLGFLL